MLINGYSTDPTVNEALDWIEEDLRAAVLTATERITAALAAPSADNKVLHAHASDLHRMIANLDRNKERRREQAASGR